MSFAEQSRPQKPVSLAAALAVNGSIIAAIMLSPMVVNPPAEKPRTTTVNVKPPPPPDPIVEPQTEPRPLPDIYTPPRPFNLQPDKNQAQTSDELPENPPGVADGNGKGGSPDFGIRVEDRPVLPPILKRATRDPRYASAFQPEYPSGLLVRGVEGSATIRVLVGTDGRVREASVVSATHPDFGKIAVRQALRSWRFRPATRGGEPVEDWLTIPVSFVIN